MGYDGVGLFGSSRAIIAGGLICGWAQGIAAYGNGSAVVSDTVIRDNYMYGVASAEYAKPGFNPDLGGGVWGSAGGNVIEENGIYGILHRNGYRLSARSAWWGGADPSAIAAAVFDHADDPALGVVDCSARLTAPPE